MRLTIEYKNGGAFTVEADEAEDIELLMNTALKILWGANTKAMTLDEVDKWLGWAEK